MKHENILLKSALALAIVDLVLIAAILLQVNGLVKDVLEVQNRQLEVEGMKERLEKAEELKKQKAEVKVDTSQWPVYRNNEYGLEIRYPKNWFLTDLATEKPSFSPASFIMATISNKDLQGQSYLYTEPYMVIYAFKKPEKEKPNLTLEGLKYAHGHHYPDSVIDIIDLNGKLALKERDKTSDNFSITVLGDDNFYGIEYFAHSKNEYSNIYNNIADTLQLSDGRFSITDNPQKVGWKIYSNQKYNYQLEFPNDWVVADARVSNLSLTKSDNTFAFSLPPLGFGYDASKSKISEITFNNIFAEKIEGDNSIVVNFDRDRTKLARKDNEGLIRFVYDVQHKEENIKIFNQILSTLRFVD